MMKENEINRLLETAQANYGYANQVVVAIEELCELGAVLSKYPRYDFHEDALAAIKDKVVKCLKIHLDSPPEDSSMSTRV